MIKAIVNVGMGEIHVSNSAGTSLVAPGLGSCIGLTIYDPIAKVGGMAHIVLPDSSTITKPITLPGKYADKAIPEILGKMYKLGAKKQNFVVKIAGGSQMFNLEKGANILNVGMRNIIAVKAALNKENLIIKASDTGGNKGRTLKLDVATGSVFMRLIGQQEQEI